MGFFSQLFKPQDPLRLAKKLMDEARAGNYAAVKSIVTDVVPKGFLPLHITNLLALGLFEAASHGHFKIVKLLSDHGADMNRRHAADGTTAMGIAAFGGHDKIVQFLARRAANVNSANKEGATPLMFAAGKCSAETVSKLLDAGADPSTIENGGLTAKDFASMELREEIVSLLDDAPKIGINTIGKSLGLNAPACTGGECVESYESDGLVAKVLTGVESVGPIKYLHILEVSVTGEMSPRLYITAEMNALASELQEHADVELQDMIGDLPSGFVLGMFDASGHRNLGIVEGIEDISTFSSESRSLMVKLLRRS